MDCTERPTETASGSYVKVWPQHQRRGLSWDASGGPCAVAAVCGYEALSGADSTSVARDEPKPVLYFHEMASRSP